MSTVIPEQIETVAREAFEFLSSRPGCRVEEDGERWQFKQFTYVFEEVGFEVYLEYKDPTVDVQVCRLLEGRPPPSAHLVVNGQRVRLSLREALILGTDADRALAAELVNGISRLPMGKPEAMIPAIRIFARVLKAAMDRLPSYYSRLFPALG